MPRGTWLEPSAGHGAIIRAAEVHPATNIESWIAVELRTEANQHLAKLKESLNISVHCPVDFLRQYSPRRPIDVIIGNPPYSEAEAHIRKCLSIAPWVIMLLRSSFDGSKGRIPLHEKYKSHKDILPERPPFAHGETDMVDSAWFIWTPDREVKAFSTWSLRPLNKGQMSLFEEVK